MSADDAVGWATPAVDPAPIPLDTLRAELRVTRCEVDAFGIATVWLHRPDRRNSWTARMNAEYRAVMAALDTDPGVRVAVVRGTGTSFCVGADARALSGYVGAGSYDPGLPVDAARPGFGVRPEYDDDMVWHLGLRLPVIAAVNGACAGVAVALAACCDIRFGVADAKITTSTARLGLPAEYGLSWLLPRLMGVTHATDLLLSGRVTTGRELHAMGFFNAVYEREDFDDAVGRYALGLAEASPLAVTTAKRQIYSDLLSADPARSVRVGRALTGSMMQLPDYREGITALTEKRPPRFGPAAGYAGPTGTTQQPDSPTEVDHS